MTTQKKSNVLAVIIILLLTFFVFSSCSHWGWAYKNQNEICNNICDKRFKDSINTQTTTDTTTTFAISMEPNEDASQFWFQMYLICDSSGTIVEKENGDLKKENNKFKIAFSKIDSLTKFNNTFQYSYSIKNNILSLKVWQDSIKVLHKKITIIEKEKQEVVKIKDQLISEKSGMNKWILVSIGLNILLIFVIVLIYKILKK